jgi:UDP-N-acetylmuramate: L-alanyl-gamma-D-glutamyl-meso-diaminopimelate ligase
LNNLEYDHADIFADIKAIQLQFHHLLRTVPAGGLVLAPSNDEYLNEVLSMGCWTPVARVGNSAPKKLLQQDNGERWSVADITANGASFNVMLNDDAVARIEWNLLGKHNQQNALNAVAAARHAGVPPAQSIEALNRFEGVKRRLEVIYASDSLVVYDDFAHHPTAIRSTLEGLRKQVGSDDILAVIEPRTHTMSLGTLRHELTTCCAAADKALWFRSDNIKWDLAEVVQACVIPARMIDKHEGVVNEIAKLNTSGASRKTHVVIMSNGAFGGIYQKLLQKLGDSPAA